MCPPIYVLVDVTTDRGIDRQLQAEESTLETVYVLKQAGLGFEARLINFAPGVGQSFVVIVVVPSVTVFVTVFVLIELSMLRT